MKNVYLTSAGVFLPNGAIDNDEMEHYLGMLHGQPSNARLRILGQNGIKTRYYALDKSQNSTHSNAEMASMAIKQAIDKSAIRASEIELLCTGTTQADLPVPGFASMVHALLPTEKCEVASFQSVCASGMMAIKHAYSQIKCGEKTNAVVCGSEFSSRLFKSTRFEAQGVDRLPFDAEFLRWMLSDGAGAFVLEDKPSNSAISLQLEWIDIQSHAKPNNLCMYTGIKSNKEEKPLSWLDYPDYTQAANDGALNLKQDIRLLDEVVKTGVKHYFELIDRNLIQPNQVNWLCCHYSSEFFKGPIQQLMKQGGGEITEDRWFSNLSTKGNTGSASIFIMLEELLYSGKLKAGDQILCMVPESGRFITSFMQFKVVMPTTEHSQAFPIRSVEAPELVVNNNPVLEWLVRQLAQIWIDFEEGLLEVEIIKKIHSGNISLEDYKLLLHDLRQQVIDGSQWISRAASNIDIELFDLRSAFIRHTATEHKDYQMLEKNFVALGAPLQEIQTGKKNIGSLALSSFIFQQASKTNPIDLLGAMFIIEGIGKRLAAFWGEMIMKQLNLHEHQVSFFTYHGVADENHFHRLEEALNHPAMNKELAERIAKTAKTTARLYKMQLEELGNY